MGWQEEYNQKLITAKEAASLVKSGDTVYIGTCGSMACSFGDALAEIQDKLENVTLTSGLLMDWIGFLNNANPEAFRMSSFFMGPYDRQYSHTGNNDFTSINFSQLDIWCRDICPPDIAVFEVTVPDDKGYMSYSAAGVALSPYVKESAKKIFVEVNKQAPWVYGEMNRIHISEVDAVFESDRPLFEKYPVPFTDEIKALSDNIVERIPDGACVQLGVGGVSDAVGYGLKNKNDLGVYSELVTDALAELMKLGVVNNSRKTFMKGKTVASFSFGTKALYDYIDHNEDFYYMPLLVVNDPWNIAKNDNMISVNTALSIDLFGQVCADNIAGVQYSGTGGQLDFVRGAQMAKGGKSFIAVTSDFTSKKHGRMSRIVAQLPKGAAVTTPRSDVQYVVTEYGCVNLKTLSMRQRAHALIEIAHPDFREELRSEAKKLGML